MRLPTKEWKYIEDCWVIDTFLGSFYISNCNSNRRTLEFCRKGTDKLLNFGMYNSVAAAQFAARDIYSLALRDTS